MIESSPVVRYVIARGCRVTAQFPLQMAQFHAVEHCMTVWIFIGTVLLALLTAAVIGAVLAPKPRIGGGMEPNSSGLPDARYRRNRAWDAAVTRARNRHSKAA